MSAKEPLFAFFGTPRFAVMVLDELERKGLVPVLVVTAPDKPRGRGLELSPSPAKAWALARGIDVLTPATLKDEQLVADLQNTDWDVFVTAAYAKLIPQSILDIPRRGCLNVHPSLLPKYRGPSPALSAILADDRQTGISVMQMSATMDAGPIVAQARIEISEEEWPPKGQMLEDLLATEGGAMVAEVIEPWIAGELTPEPQQDAAATFTRKFTDDDAKLDLSGNARENLLKIRAFDHGPRAYFVDTHGKRIVVTDAHLEGDTLVIDRVIPEGKKEMDYEAYTRGSGSM